MGAITVDTGANEQCCGEIIREVLYGDALICTAECIEIDVVSTGEMSAEVVFVAAASIEHDGSLGGIGVIDELLCVSDGDGPDFGGVAVADECEGAGECECCEESAEHGYPWNWESDFLYLSAVITPAIVHTIL